MGRAAEFGSARHLVTRFFEALWPGGPSPADEQWALGWLLPGEQRLWHQMSGPDRRHAVGVARRTLDLLGDSNGSPGRQVVASALLHDVGKVESGLGTVARAAVTAIAIVVGRDSLVADTGSDGRERRWRLGIRQYLTHDRIGAEMLRQAGSDPLTVTWAREHHLERSRWSVDLRLADALKAADGD
jgi:HD domain-containing protein